MPRETKGSFCRIEGDAGNHKKCLSVPFQFPQVKTSFYTLNRELVLIAQVLGSTGLRASEVLSLKKSDIIKPRSLHIKSMKRSKERIIVIDKDLFDTLSEHTGDKETVFKSNYREIYRFIKSGKAGTNLIKNKKNFSVCHTLRKLYIRNQLFNLGRTVEEITAHIGWLKKTSILYYI